MSGNVFFVGVRERVVGSGGNINLILLCLILRSGRLLSVFCDFSEKI